MRFMVVIKTGRDSAASATPSAETPMALWRKITMFNPVITLIGGVRSFYGDLSSAGNLTASVAFAAVCIAALCWLVKTGLKAKD